MLPAQRVCLGPLGLFLAQGSVLLRPHCYLLLVLGNPIVRQTGVGMARRGDAAHSSGVGVLNSMVFSSYGRRQAGHSPFIVVLMLLKQN